MVIQRTVHESIKSLLGFGVEMNSLLFHRLFSHVHAKEVPEVWRPITDSRQTGRQNHCLPQMRCEVEDPACGVGKASREFAHATCKSVAIIESGTGKFRQQFQQAKTRHEIDRRNRRWPSAGELSRGARWLPGFGRQRTGGKQLGPIR